MKRLLLVLSLCGVVRAQVAVPSPAALLSLIHDQAAQLATSERVDILYELAIAATGTNSKASGDWSIEMYNLATNGMSDEQMNRAAQRKNALTVLSFTDPEAAAKHFFELEPSPGHLPYEDPRVDLARHLFPRLWAKEGSRSLPLIRRLASFTASSGEYPYAAMALLLPLIAQANLRSAQALFIDAVHRMPSGHGIHRTQLAYLQFLRAGWPIASQKSRREAIRAGVSNIEPAAGGHTYSEYYLPQGTVKLDSEEAARIYELLPFADQADPNLGQILRQRYPHLRGLPVPDVTVATWRSAAYAPPGHDTRELIERAFARRNILFLAMWAQQDAVRAAQVALSAKDLDLQRTGLALVLPEYARADAAQAETWRLALASKAQSEANPSLSFLVALIRADFRLGHSADAQQLAWSAWRQTSHHVEENSEAIQELEDVCGQFWYGDPGWYSDLDRVKNQATRLTLLAKYARGALRNSAGYQEPT